MFTWMKVAVLFSSLLFIMSVSNAKVIENEELQSDDVCNQIVGMWHGKSLDDRSKLSCMWSVDAQIVKTDDSYRLYVNEYNEQPNCGHGSYYVTHFYCKNGIVYSNGFFGKLSKRETNMTLSLDTTGGWRYLLEK